MSDQRPSESTLWTAPTCRRFVWLRLVAAFFIVERVFLRLGCVKPPPTKSAEVGALQGVDHIRRWPLEANKKGGARKVAA